MKKLILIVACIVALMFAFSCINSSEMTQLPKCCYGAIILATDKGGYSEDGGGYFTLQTKDSLFVRKFVPHGLYTYYEIGDTIGNIK